MNGQTIQDAGELLQRVDRLLSAIETLAGSHAVEAVVRLARELGLGEAIASAVHALQSLLARISGALEELREPLRLAGVYGGLSAVLEPLVGGLTRLASCSRDELDEAGLGVLGSTLEPVRVLTDRGTRVLEGARTLAARVPDVADLDRLQAGLARTSATLAAYGGPA